MISERNVAEKFSPIWKEVLPMLTPNFMKVFNESHVVKVDSKKVRHSNSYQADIISEIAFLSSKNVFNNEISLDDLLKGSAVLSKNIELANMKAAEYHSDVIPLSNLTKAEVNELRQLIGNLLRFIKSRNGVEVEFSPSLKGFGFLKSCMADLSVDNALFEIKTVNRKFRSKDLKQLFIYLALHQAMGENKWLKAGLYNPRMNVYCEFNVDGMIKNLSGGKSSKMALRELLESLTRDVEIEKHF
ncbi:MAG: hypothetical protein ABJG78_00445 [Cyclobacteriaceae bacterium]